MKKIALWYLGFFLLFSLFYFSLFRTPFFADQTILFYRGVALLCLLAIVELITGIYIAVKTQFIGIETTIAAVIMSASIHLALFVVFPVTFDRSVTMYLLNSLQTKTAECNGLNKTNLETNFISGYVEKQDAVGRRIKEQAVTDFVRQNGTCISLTDKGKSFIRFSETVKKIYGLK